MLAIVPVKNSELKTSFSLLKKKNCQIEEGLKTYYHKLHLSPSFLQKDGRTITIWVCDLMLGLGITKSHCVPQVVHVTLGRMLP